jgi:DNA oxidative demethylase
LAIPGFQLIPDFLSTAEEERLLYAMAEWAFARIPMRGGYLRRELLCFGVDFGANFVTLRAAASLPRALQPLRARCAATAGYAPAELNQAIVQRYTPGAGLGWHRDDPRLGPVVIGVSLGSEAMLKFAETRSRPRPATVRLRVPARSLYVMEGDAREQWFHALAAVRQLRISITFRAAPRLLHKTLKKPLQHAITRSSVG